MLAKYFLSLFFFLCLSWGHPNSTVPCTKPLAEHDCGIGDICIPEPDSNLSFCYCENDAACGSMSLVCRNNTRCEHKGLWPPDVLDITSVLILVVISALAAASGTGGGGLLVALFIAMELFPAKEAMPLSKASILGGAIANFFYNFRDRHPAADRPLIDYDLVGVMEPFVLLGTVVGVYAIKLLPSWLVLILLVLVCSYTAYKTFTKALSIHKTEKEAASARAFSDSDDEEHALDIQEARSELVKLETGTVADEWQSAHQDEIAVTLESEKATPWLKILSFILIWASVFVVSFLKGGEGHSSLVGIECGSVGYWLLVTSLVPIFSVYTFVFGYLLKKRYDRKVEIDFPFLQTDMKWSTSVLIKLPFFGFFAGICAGLFGIGSGMIVGPIILAHQVPPRVVSAVSAFMILFTASSTTIQFSVFGLLRYDYAGWYASFGFVGALLGQLVIGYFISKYNKHSVVAFILTGMIVSSVLALSVMGILDIVKKREQGASFWALAPLCPRD